MSFLEPSVLKSRAIFFYRIFLRVKYIPTVSKPSKMTGCYCPLLQRSSNWVVPYNSSHPFHATCPNTTAKTWPNLCKRPTICVWPVCATTTTDHPLDWCYFNFKRVPNFAGCSKPMWYTTRPEHGKLTTSRYKQPTKKKAKLKTMFQRNHTLL